MTATEEQTGAVTVPIFQTSTYVQPELGRNKGYEYARTKNPTRSALEANLAALERGMHAHCFASGMSATDTVFRTLEKGDHVVAGENMYGGSYRLFSRVCEKFGIEFTYVDTANVANVKVDPDRGIVMHLRGGLELAIDRGLSLAGVTTSELMLPHRMV